MYADITEKIEQDKHKNEDVRSPDASDSDTTESLCQQLEKRFAQVALTYKTVIELGNVHNLELEIDCQHVQIVTKEEQQKIQVLQRVLFGRIQTLETTIKDAGEIVDDVNQERLYALVTASLSLCAYVYSLLDVYDKSVVMPLTQCASATDNQATEIQRFGFVQLMETVRERLSHVDISLMTIQEQTITFASLWKCLTLRHPHKLKGDARDILSTRCLQFVKESQYTQFALNFSVLMSNEPSLNESALPVTCGLYQEAMRKLTKIADAGEIISAISACANIYENKIAEQVSECKRVKGSKRVQQLAMFDLALQLKALLDEFPMTDLGQLIQILAPEKIDEMNKIDELHVLANAEPIWPKLRMSLSKLNRQLSDILGYFDKALKLPLGGDEIQDFANKQNLLLAAGQALSQLLSELTDAELTFNQHHIKTIKLRRNTPSLDLVVSKLGVKTKRIKNMKAGCEAKAAKWQTMLTPAEQRAQEKRVEALIKEEVIRQQQVANTKRLAKQRQEEERAKEKAEQRRQQREHKRQQREQAAEAAKVAEKEEAERKALAKQRQLTDQLIAVATNDMCSDQFGSADHQLEQVMKMTKGRHEDQYFQARIQYYRCHLMKARLAIVDKKCAEASDIIRDNDVLQISLASELEKLNPNNSLTARRIEDLKVEFKGLQSQYQFLPQLLKLYQAEAAIKANDYAAAETILKPLSSLESYYLSAWLQAQIANHRGDTPAALKWVESAVVSIQQNRQKLPHDFHYFPQASDDELVTLLLAMAKWQMPIKALTTYEQCLAIAPQTPQLPELILATLKKVKAEEDASCQQAARKQTFAVDFTPTPQVSLQLQLLKRYVPSCSLVEVYGGFVRDQGNSVDIDAHLVVANTVDINHAFDLQKWYAEVKDDKQVPIQLIPNPYIKGLYTFRRRDQEFDCTVIHEQDYGPDMFMQLDTTRNACYKNVETGEFGDPTGLGKHDIAKHIVRVINFDNVEKSTVTGKSNCIMLLRILRDAAKPQNTLAPIDARIMPYYAHRIVEAEPGQLASEMEKQLCRGNAVNGLQILQQFGYLRYLFPSANNLIIDDKVNPEILHYFDCIDRTIQQGQSVRIEQVLVHLYQQQFVTIFNQALPCYAHDKGKISKALIDAAAEIQKEAIVLGCKDSQSLINQLKLSVLKPMFYQHYLKEMMRWASQSNLDYQFAQEKPQVNQAAITSVSHKAAVSASNLYVYEGLNETDKLWLLEQFNQLVVAEQYAAMREYYQKMLAQQTQMPQSATTSTSTSAGSYPVQDTAGVVVNNMMMFGIHCYRQLPTMGRFSINNAKVTQPTVVLTQQLTLHSK